MRLLPLCLLLVPLLAACDANTPKAPSTETSAATTAPAKPTKPAAVPAGFPLGARPMLGTWATDLANCGDPAKLTTVAATSYDVGGKSCELSVKDNKDGTFAATCGKQNLTMTPIFGPTGEGIRIAQGEGKPTNVFRCRR